MLSLGLNPMNPPLMGTRFIMQVLTLLITVNRMNVDHGLGDINYIMWIDVLAVLQLIVIILGIVGARAGLDPGTCGLPPAHPRSPRGP